MALLGSSLGHLLFCFGLFSSEKWQPGELVEKRVSLYYIISCWGPGEGMGEEHIQHLLGGVKEPKLSFSSYFKIGLGFQLVMRVIV